MPFGETFVEEKSSGNFSNPYKFSGQELDKNTGFYLFGARYYNPKTSLWLSLDPLAELFPSVGGYVYSYNNPIMFSDPTGLEPEKTGGEDTGNNTPCKLCDILKIAENGILKDYLGNLNSEKGNNTKQDNPKKRNHNNNNIVNLNIPEANFSNHYGGYYLNPNNSKGVKKEYASTRDIIGEWYTETAPENALIVSGNALEQVKNEESVKKNLNKLLLNIKKPKAGKVLHLYHEGGSISEHPKPALELVKLLWDKLTSHPSDKSNHFLNSDLANNPMSVLGSYGMSLRINPDAKTATIALYNSLSLSSGLDNLFGNSVDKHIKTTYQTFIWIIPLKK